MHVIILLEGLELLRFEINHLEGLIISLSINKRLKMESNENKQG